jgi:hypothetical protein
MAFMNQDAKTAPKAALPTIRTNHSHSVPEHFRPSQTMPMSEVQVELELGEFSFSTSVEMINARSIIQRRRIQSCSSAYLQLVSINVVVMMARLPKFWCQSTENLVLFVPHASIGFTNPKKDQAGVLRLGGVSLYDLCVVGVGPGTRLRKATRQGHPGSGHYLVLAALSRGAQAVHLSGHSADRHLSRNMVSKPNEEPCSTHGIFDLNPSIQIVERGPSTRDFLPFV